MSARNLLQCPSAQVELGARAYRLGERIDANPYFEISGWSRWATGWLSAWEDDECAARRLYSREWREFATRWNDTVAQGRPDLRLDPDEL